jgi:hypothetical protein
MLIDYIVFQTNLYATQRYGLAYQTTTAEEIKIFLGISILMGTNNCPAMRTAGHPDLNCK